MGWPPPPAPQPLALGDALAVALLDAKGFGAEDLPARIPAAIWVAACSPTCAILCTPVRTFLCKGERMAFRNRAGNNAQAAGMTAS